MTAEALKSIIKKYREKIEESVEEYWINDKKFSNFEDFIDEINKFDQSQYNYLLDLCTRDYPLNYGVDGLKIVLERRYFKQIKVFIERISNNSTYIPHTLKAIEEFGITN